MNNLGNKNFVILFFKILTIALFLFIVFLQLHHSFYFPVWRDDAQIGNVAKNLAMGDGYQMALFDKNYKFYFHTNTGPVLIVPAALLIAIFGSKSWVINIAAVLVILALHIAIFFALKKIFVKEEKKWQFSLLALSLLFVVTNAGDYAFETGDRIGLWHYLMGEISACLLVVLGTFLLFLADFNYKKILVSAFILGLSTIDKSIAMIAIPGILAVFAAKLYSEKSLKPIEKAKLIVSAGLVAISPFVLFEFVKIIFMGWSDYYNLLQYNINFYRLNGVITKVIEVGGRRFEPSAAFHIQLFSYITNINFFFFVVSSFFLIKASYKNRARDHVFFISWALVFAFVLNIIWWIFISNGSDRYLVPTLFYYIVAISMLLVTNRYNRWVYSNLVLLYVALIFVLNKNQINYILFDSLKENPRLEEQLKIVKEVTKLKEEGVVTISCGNNFEIEYLLPNSKNFIDCKELLTGSLKKEKVMLVSYFIDHENEVRLKYGDYYGIITPVSKDVELRCKKLYLKTDNFLMRWCS